MKSKPSQKHIPKRSPKNATLTISLPKELKEKIEQMAKDDRRTVSNYVVVELAKKLGITLCLALSAFHLTRSPKDWSVSALEKTGKAAIAFVSSKF